MMSVKLLGGGRRSLERFKRMKQGTLQNVVRASNTSGRWARTRIRRELRELLNVSLKTLKLQERESRARRNKPYYQLRYLRREFRPDELRKTRFRRGRRGGSFGSLTFTAYGKRTTLTGVYEGTGRYGRFYTVETTSRPKDEQGRYPRRRVQGTFIKADYRGPARVKKELRDRFIREFRRLSRLKRRR